jgi:hypothetical protein
MASARNPSTKAYCSLSSFNLCTPGRRQLASANGQLALPLPTRFNIGDRDAGGKRSSHYEFFADSVSGSKVIKRWSDLTDTSRRRPISVVSTVPEPINS